MKTVVNEYHKANLAVLNLGPNPGIFFSGAHAMNELVRPASVILTHPNEPVTEGGKLRPASRATLMKQLKPAALTSPSADARWSSTAKGSASPDAEPRRRTVA